MCLWRWIPPTRRPSKPVSRSITGPTASLIVNSADAGSRISNIDLAAANDAICIALCSADWHCKGQRRADEALPQYAERGLSLGMEATDLWFDPLFLVVKGMQDKQMDVLNAIKLVRRRGPEVHRRSVQQLQRRSQERPSHHGLRPGSHGHDAGPDLRHREPLRPAADGDHQVLRHLQEPRALLDSYRICKRRIFPHMRAGREPLLPALCINGAVFWPHPRRAKAPLCRGSCHHP